jgi:methionine synthase II (cobalamin-independent)
MQVHLPPGAASAIGSLPHTDAHAAAALALEVHPDLPAIPSLPHRSPVEGMLAQSAVGIRGVTFDAQGCLIVDADRLDPLAPITTDLGDDAFTGFRAFLDAANGRRGPVKWQLTGPITLGLALVRRGAPLNLAFELASRAIRCRLRVVHRAVTDALPGASQVVFLDEPALTQLMRPDFPIATDVAIDLVSGALASIEATAMVGLHCCGSSDWAAVLASGPSILSIPVHPDLVQSAGYLASFLDGGGVIAWGAVPTDRPIASSSDRYWEGLAALWCDLVRAGCDAIRLRTQSLVTPACGLAGHDVRAAELALRLAAEVAERVHGQAVATRMAIGA